MKGHCLKELNLLDRYATNRDDLVADFYDPCLGCAVSYKRAVGYFSASILLLTAQPIVDFAQRGGRIQLICSPELAEEDIRAFETGYKWRDLMGKILLRNIQEAFDDIKGKTIIEFIATLIAVDCLDIHIAFRPGARGIFHDKVGVLNDSDGHSVSFIGSVNETMNAWDTLGNHESFDVFKSWGIDSLRVDRHAKYFESLWNGDEPGVETISFPQVARDRLVAVANSGGVAAAYRKVVLAQTESRKTPQPHQIAAIEAWKAHGKRGILQHATGSGKTITAINAIRDWVKEGCPVLVLVPSELLLAYWRREIQSELGDVGIKLMLAGGGYTSWRKRSIIEDFTIPEGSPRIILATLQTASSPYFLQRIQGGKHLMIVIDEVHRSGSPTSSNVLSIETGPRLGLSATPHRYGDPDGTNRILDYFEGVIDPPFTLADAIAAGRLCNYTYHIHPVPLTDEEMNRWLQLTKTIKHQIALSKAKDPPKTTITDNIKKLMIKRSDILKNAEAKISLAVQILQDYYMHDQRWLVYCDDQTQLLKVRTAIEQAGFSCDEYHSSMAGDREATLDHFSYKGGIIVAIRCLDEGVDIPAVDHALILASSRNPREFVQRRGRVLRKVEGKFYAEIHDAFVIPPSVDDNPDAASIVRVELARALQFAENATNEAVKFHLRQIARDSGIDPKLISVDEFNSEEIE